MHDVVVRIKLLTLWYTKGCFINKNARLWVNRMALLHIANFLELRSQTFITFFDVDTQIIYFLSSGGNFCWISWFRNDHVSWFLPQIFMHKSAMQMQHARDIQRNGQSAPGSGMGGEIKPHQCQQCLKSFSSNHQLVQHIRVHTGEKPYKCTYCDRRFKQLSHVQQHTRLHTGKLQMFTFVHAQPLRPSYFAKGKHQLEHSPYLIFNFNFEFNVLY